MGQFLSSQCCDKKEQAPKSLLQVGPMLNLNQDYQYFFSQDWFGIDKPQFEPQKFIYIYPGYKEDQSQMENFWSKADTINLRHGELVRQKGKVLNKKWQYLIRKGVPCSLAKKIILDTFRLTYVDCEAEYLSALKVVFKNKQIPKTFKNVPLFGCNTNENDEDEEFNYLNESEKKIQLILKVQILNQQGIEALIRLLWIVNNLNHFLEYNPMLLHIIVLLLIFLSEAQTYCVLQFMIKDSQQCLNDHQNKQQLRWHLIMNEEHFKETATTFYETVSKRSKTFSNVYQFMQNIHFDSFELFQEMSINLMLTYLPFSTVLKIFIIYLNEGIKIYFRIFYSVLRYISDDIKSCKSNSNFKSIFRKKLMNLNIEQQNNIIKQAFKLSLSESEQVKSYMRTAVSYSKNQPCYLPIPSQASDLITNEQAFIDI
ncbi:unnamed protein product [Paramecium sonneborni]|uniref:Rab-GAP TBC domain-containing protein n=1 Tax=Paramecium sonneborni TaxID=65129 RepID=A0A8S1L872_9CILI|nr:unnamed protein product [Paramecium sonneborni]